MKLRKNYSPAEISLTQFIQNTTWAELSPEVKERAIICLMDNLAAALAGTQARSAYIAAETAAELFPANEATLFCTGRKASPLGAAFANGVAGNALDIDDYGLYTWGHPGAQILPAALALCESRKSSGAEMLAATVVGYEVMFRAGRCWYDRDPMLRGCGSWGSLGTTALAANCIGLTPDQILNALGIAEFHSPSLPLMKSVDEPAMVKHGIGIGAYTGIMSAELAKRGFTGISSLFSQDEYQDWVGDIGEHFILPYGMSWKDFSCCAWTHAALLAMQNLLDEQEFSVEEIAKINIEVYEEAAHLGVELPKTTEEAQFNLAWPIAALIVDGVVGPKQVLEPRLSDKTIRAIAGRVKLTVSPKLTRLYELSEIGDSEGKDAARVTVELTDGQRLESGISCLPLYADQKWSRVRMERKFRWLLNELIPDPVLRQLIKTIWGFDELNDVSDFIALIAGLRLTPRY
jgi:2-methylcitrate dehydratase PrpD